MKLIRLIFILLSAIHMFIGVASSKTLVERIEKLQKHSDTYYWLSLERNNEIVDIKKSLIHLKNALNLVSDIKDPKILEAKEHQLNVAIKEAEIQESKYKAQLNNYSPLFSLILNKEKVLTFKNITELVAAKKSAVNSLGVLPGPIKNNSTLYTLIILEDEFASIEESIRDVVTDSSSFYPVARHELAMFLSSKEMRELNNIPIPEELLKKISENLGDNKLGILRVLPIDNVDGVSYWLSKLRLWGDIPMKISRTYVTTGLSELINQRPYYVLLLMLLGFPYVFFINWIYKSQKGSSVPHWFAAATAIFSFLFVYISFEGLSLLDINEQSFTTTVEGYKWVMAIVAIINLFPLVVSYIMISRIPAISPLLNTASAISTLIFGVFVGAYNYLGFLAAYRLGIKESLEIMIPAFVILWILSVQLGKSLSRYIDTHRPTVGIESVFLSIWLYLFTIFVLKWDINLLLQTSSVVLILAFSTGYIIENFAKLIKEISTKKIIKVEKVSNFSGLDWLSKSIDNPVFFKDPWLKEFDEAVNFIVEDTDEKIEFIYIEGGLGCGKTRAAKEIGLSIQSRFKDKNTEAIVLFGSCEEIDAGESNTPYQPFSQALGEFIGIGRFSDPAERAEKLQSGLLGAGLKVAMNATGTGALSTLLGSESEDNGVRKTNPREIATVISETLVNLAQQNKSKVVFILDDTQWMDQQTFDLFELLIEMLSKNFNNNECCFILTSRPVDQKDKVKKMLLTLSEEEIISLEMNINEKILGNESIVINILQTFRFEFRSQQALVSYFSSLGVNRPLHVLQTLATLLKKKMIEPFGDRFIIRDLDSIKKLPPSSDYKAMLDSLLGECDDRLISILHCCAIIGQEFKISLIAEIFKIDPLKFLEILEEAVEAKILMDVPNFDDVYAFVDKRIRGCIKFISYDENSTKFLTTQRVRIYHKRFLALKEEGLSFDDLTAGQIDYDLALTLAYHANYIKDVFPDKAVKYNRIAAEKSYFKGMTSNAVELYLNALSATKIFGCKTNLNVLFDLYISYSKCLLDAQKDPTEALTILDEASQSLKENHHSSSSEVDHLSWVENEIIILRALACYRLRHFDESLSYAKKVLSSKVVDLSQACRAEFYQAASFPPSEPELRKTAHLKVLRDIDHAIQKGELNDSLRIELLKVKSEALNNLGFIFLFGLKEPNDALPYFKEAAELNIIPEINDQKGVGISHGGMGDCFKAQGELLSAEEAYKINLKISTENGDLQGVCRMNSMLGKIYLDKAGLVNEPDEELFGRASIYYEDSLVAAVSQKNGINIAFALVGIIEVAVASNKHASFDYVLEEFDRFVNASLHKSIPDFAKNQLKESLKTVKTTSPELADKVDGLIKCLDSN
jgi:tetratricopeptide (TPR) repeat protein